MKSKVSKILFKKIDKAKNYEICTEKKNNHIPEEIKRLISKYYLQFYSYTFENVKEREYFQQNINYQNRLKKK